MDHILQMAPDSCKQNPSASSSAGTKPNGNLFRNSGVCYINKKIFF